LGEFGGRVGKRFRSASLGGALGGALRERVGYATLLGEVEERTEGGL